MTKATKKDSEKRKNIRFQPDPGTTAKIDLSAPNATRDFNPTLTEVMSLE
jgi:hypothetical protein